MSYKGELSEVEVFEFLADFRQLETFYLTMTIINPIPHTTGRFEVILAPKHSTADLLDATFRDGLLNHDGWSKHFRRQSVAAAA